MKLPERDGLDRAIDHIAARMVAPPDVGEVTRRIIAALPDRPSRLRWLLPPLAAVGTVAIAALVWATSHGPGPMIATRPSAVVAGMSGLANVVAANEPRTAFRTRTAVRTMPLVPLEPLAPLERFPERDHDRALPPIAALSALSVDEVSPSSIAPSPLLALVPIAIVELPMTADFPPE